MRPLILTMGEPAGIGADLCVLLFEYLLTQPIVLCGDIDLLRQRAARLGKATNFHKEQDLHSTGRLSDSRQSNNRPPNSLPVRHIPLSVAARCGQLEQANAAYVIKMLRTAAQATQNGEYSGIVTAPIHKGIICQAGGRYAHFSGHTEFFAEQTGTAWPVMVLANQQLKVGLVTTHLPLQAVSTAITAARLSEVLRIIHHDMQRYFTAGRAPKIGVCGLNPHAGESGYIGREEVTVINPVLKRLRAEGLAVSDALPADTLFVPAHAGAYDIIVAMYHDQGLPVIKSQGFGECVNITFGLPIIRTSVDHGTALDLAGTGRANPNSLRCAIEYAKQMAA